MEPPLSMLVFSGDVDGIVPVLGTRRWIRSLDLPITRPWRPWTSSTGAAASVIRCAVSGEQKNWGDHGPERNRDVALVGLPTTRAWRPWTASTGAAACVLRCAVGAEQKS